MTNITGGRGGATGNGLEMTGGQGGSPGPGGAGGASLGQQYADALHAFDANSDKYLADQFAASLECQPVGTRALESLPPLNPDGSIASDTPAQPQ